MQLATDKPAVVTEELLVGAMLSWPKRKVKLYKWQTSELFGCEPASRAANHKAHWLLHWLVLSDCRCALLNFSAKTMQSQNVGVFFLLFFACSSGNGLLICLKQTVDFTIVGRWRSKVSKSLVDLLYLLCGSVKNRTLESNAGLSVCINLRHCPHGELCCTEDFSVAHRQTDGCNNVH